MNLSLEAYSKFALEKLTAIERVNLRSTHSLNYLIYYREQTLKYIQLETKIVLPCSM